jgi:hypothetical protein
MTFQARADRMTQTAIEAVGEGQSAFWQALRCWRSLRSAPASPAGGSGGHVREPDRSARPRTCAV